MQRIITSLALASLSLVASFTIVATWPDQPVSVQTAADKAMPVETPAANVAQVVDLAN